MSIKIKKLLWLPFLILTAGLILAARMDQSSPPVTPTAVSIIENSSTNKLTPPIDQNGFLTQPSYKPIDAKYFDLIDRTFDLNPAELAMLEQNGFAVTERLAFKDFSTAYAYIYWKDLPVLVTTDSILHTMHQTYDDLLVNMEQTILTTKLSQLLRETHDQLKAEAKANSDPNLKPLYTDLDTYLTVPMILLTGPAEAAGSIPPEAATYIQLAEQAEIIAPISLFGSQRQIDFTLFKPRGHYNQNPQLENYFRAVSWLEHVDFRLLEYTSQGQPSLNIQQLGAATLLRQAIEQANQRSNWEDLDAILRMFIGESDNMTLPDLDRFLHDAQLQAPADAFTYSQPQQLARMLQSGDYGQQLIAGQTLQVDPNKPDPLPRPINFALMGPRFIVDSFITTQLTFDRLIVGGQKVTRAIPSPLDVMYVLGNEQAKTHLQDELTRYGYQQNLQELRDRINEVPANFWESNLYNRWLSTLRALNKTSTGLAYPQSMRTAAWADKMLQTQLGSWVQLRHDNILYAKQSQATALCEYPAGYVEPYPEFYENIANYAQTGQVIFSNFTVAEPEQYIYDTAIKYFDDLKNVAEQLKRMSQKELALQPFNSEEELFLKSIAIRQYESFDTICAGIMMREEWDGWYMDLLPWQDSNPALIADIHTNATNDLTGPLSPPGVLHVATGPVAANLFIADTDEGPTMYIGPAFTYYEVFEAGYPPKRLTDNDWNERLNTTPRPAPPPWTGSFRITKPEPPNYLLLPDKPPTPEAAIEIMPPGPQSTPLPSNDLRQQADALFQEGISLLFEDKNFEAALLNLELAQQLYHSLNEPELEADTLTGVGIAQFHLGQSGQALATQQAALTLAQSVGSLRVEADALSNLGEIYTQLEQFELALSKYKQALEIRQNNISIIINIADVYNISGDYEPAIAYYRQALDLLPEIGPKTSQNILSSYVQIYGRLSNLLTNMIRYEEALDYYERALPLARRLADKDREIWLLNNIGLTYAQLGRFREALKQYQKALSLLEAANLERANVLNNMAVTYSALKDEDKALTYFKESLAISEAANDYWLQANTLISIGNIRVSQQAYEQALVYDQRALALFKQISQKTNDRWGEAIALHAIANVYVHLNQYQSALDYLQQALTLFTAGDDRLMQASTLAGIGKIYEQQEDTEQAIKFYRQSLDMIEAIQQEIKTEEFKGAFLGNQVQLNPYARLVRLLIQKGQKAEAFEFVERAKARAFLDQLANGPVDLHTSVNADLLAQEKTLQSEIVVQHNQLYLLYQKPTSEWDMQAIGALRAKINELESQYAELLVELKRQDPETASLITVEVASLAEIQQLLDPKITLVEYFVTAENVWAFVITAHTVEAVSLDINRQDLENQLASFRTSPVDPNNAHPPEMQKLYTWLITPLKSYLKTSGLGFVPHGILHYVPFAALTDGKRNLIDDYTVFTLPSASVLRYLLPKQKVKLDTILALGNPITTEPNLSILNFAEIEVERIAHMYGNKPLIEAAATESILHRQASQATILHLAAHGQYNPANPLFSTIFLAPDDQNDGRLEVHEIYNLDLRQRTGLVVLSACETAIGDLSNGDELVSLNRAFFYAGTPTVIASLWSVDDNTTGLLMKYFYTHLRAGLGKAEALRQAQLEVRAEYPNPYHWAAFVLSGDTGEITNMQPLDQASSDPAAPSSPVISEATPPLSKPIAKEDKTSDSCLSLMWPLALLGVVLWQRRSDRRYN